MKFRKLTERTFSFGQWPGPAAILLFVLSFSFSVPFSVPVPVSVPFSVSVSPILAHTPYNQWIIYRQKHLIIASTKPGYSAAVEIATVLRKHLPKSKARVARTANNKRLMSLFTTKQIPMIFLHKDEVAAWKKSWKMTHEKKAHEKKSRKQEDGDKLSGDKLYGDKLYGAHDFSKLRLVFPYLDYRLISNKSFPKDHAILIAESLYHHLDDVDDGDDDRNHSSSVNGSRSDSANASHTANASGIGNSTGASSGSAIAKKYYRNAMKEMAVLPGHSQNPIARKRIRPIEPDKTSK